MPVLAGMFSSALLLVVGAGTEGVELSLVLMSFAAGMTYFALASASTIARGARETGAPVFRLERRAEPVLAAS